MPSAKVAVVIAGTSFIVIDNTRVSSPATFSALMVKVNLPVIVGVPKIVSLDKFNPLGKLPLKTDHVIGVVPVAARIWRYAVSLTPSGKVTVEMIGEVVIGSVLNEADVLADDAKCVAVSAIRAVKL